MSREVADTFIEALWKLEKDENVDPLLEIHAEACQVGDVSVPGT